MHLIPVIIRILPFLLLLYLAAPVANAEVSVTGLESEATKNAIHQNGEYAVCLARPMRIAGLTLK
jgi:hypothetical protein